MTIGNLYDANNVIVGQAAVLFAPNGTPMIDTADFDVADPFDTAPWMTYTLDEGSGTTFTLTVNGDTTSAITKAGLTSGSLQTDLEGLASVGAGNVTVSGATGAWKITFASPVNAVLTGTGTALAVTGGLWIACGATDQGWKYGTNKSTTTISIEEQSTPVGMTISSQAVTLEGALSEDVTRTLNLAYNATSSKVAAGAGQPGYDLVELSDIVQYYAVTLLTTNPEGFGRIIYAPKWSQLSNVSTDFRRASNKRMYPVQFATLCKPAEIQVFNFTAAGT